MIIFKPYKIFITLIFLPFFSACSVNYDISSKVHGNKSINQIEIYNLQKSIEKLSKEVDKEEAQKVAEISIIYSLELANQYQLIYPPSFHNTLVNLNIRDRGLCYHFARDLAKELKKEKLATLDVRWAVHDARGSFEHNSLVITSKKDAFDDGIILDPWRNSGRLYWSALKEDRQYDWKEDMIDSKVYGTTGQYIFKIGF